MGRQAAMAALLVVCGYVGLSGCGGTTVFKDTEPFRLVLAAESEPAKVEHKLVKVTLDHIVIEDKIHFDIDKAVIKTESFGLLDEVVAVLNENPHIKKVNIIGHTDNDGEESYNQTLSEKRAAAVRQYLVEHGVKESRLGSEGRGESDPVVSNESFKGREKNRRVEFLITDQEKEATKQMPVEQAEAPAVP